MLRIDDPPTAAKQGADVVLGFRPEHAQLSAGDPEGIDASVGLVEQLGAQTLAVLETDTAAQGSAAPTKIRVLSSRRDDMRPGERTRIRVDRSRIHLFDAESGANLKLA